MNELKTELISTEIILSVACLSDVGRVRKNNEDAFVIADLTEAKIADNLGELAGRRVGYHGWLLAAVDGMGGAQAGEVASRIATKHLAKNLIASAGKRPVSEWLREGLVSVNRDIWQVGTERPECRGMGATMTAAIIHEGLAIIGQVGDSRGYLIREGHIQQITKDQSMVQAMIDAGMLTPEEAAVSSHRNVILKALGAKDELEPDLSLIRLAGGDYLLLCSDGLSNKVGNVEMHDIVCEATRTWLRWRGRSAGATATSPGD